jgi:hypothetical protein
VTFTPTGTNDVMDVTDLALPGGLSSEGNQFVFSDGVWRFNLGTKSYSAPGTYFIHMAPGNDMEYSVTACVAQFVIQ